MPNQTPLCQSCAMPMDAPDKFGQDTDGKQNDDYCCHCWKNGKFAYESTFEQAVEDNIPWWKEDGDQSDEEARARIKAFFPTIKRWAQA